jgi:acetyl esterase
MPLDPQVETLLRSLSERKAPRIWEIPVPEGRAMYRSTARALELKDVSIGRIENREIDGPAGKIPVRLYTPVGASSGLLPLLVYFHGGGFVIGDLETHDTTCRLICNESGVRLMAVDYRLAPENKFPAALEDAFAAVAWAEKNATDINVDANRIAVGGDSAGGCLAAQICLRARDEKAPHVAFQLLIYPGLDMNSDTPSRRRYAKGYILEEDSIKWFYKQYVPEGMSLEDRELSPLRADDFSNLPPAHIVTAEFDPLRDEGSAYADQLRAAGVEVTHIDYEGMIHGFCNMTGAIDVARTALKRAAADLRTALNTAP